MNLAERIAMRKAGLLHPCVEFDSRSVATITLCPWQGPEWTLPWTRFDALRFSLEEESECIELFFAHHHVVASGTGFRRVMAELREFKVSFLRSMPETHHVALGPNFPFVSSLEVHLLADGKSPAPAAVSYY